LERIERIRQIISMRIEKTIEAGLEKKFMVKRVEEKKQLR